MHDCDRGKNLTIIREDAEQSEASYPVLMKPNRKVWAAKIKDFCLTFSKSFN
jgi:hypothetical protein